MLIGQNVNGAVELRATLLRFGVKSMTVSVRSFQRILESGKEVKRCLEKLSFKGEIKLPIFTEGNKSGELIFWNETKKSYDEDNFKLRLIDEDTSYTEFPISMSNLYAFDSQNSHFANCIHHWDYALIFCAYKLSEHEIEHWAMYNPGTIVYLCHPELELSDESPLNEVD